jgi:patatin-like phospholipase/acyl hydrolase
LDGGGAKGFYTLGVLREIEGLVNMRLHEKFDLIFGTSTGAIIAAMLALGHSVDEIHELYKKTRRDCDGLRVGCRKNRSLESSRH